VTSKAPTREVVTAGSGTLQTDSSARRERRCMNGQVSAAVILRPLRYADRIRVAALTARLRLSPTRSASRSTSSRCSSGRPTTNVRGSPWRSFAIRSSRFTRLIGSLSVRRAAPSGSSRRDPHARAVGPCCSRDPEPRVLTECGPRIKRSSSVGLHQMRSRYFGLHRSTRALSMQQCSHVCWRVPKTGSADL